MDSEKQGMFWDASSEDTALPKPGATCRLAWTTARLFTNWAAVLGSQHWRLLCLLLRQGKGRHSPASVLTLGHSMVVLCQIHNLVCSAWNGKYTLPLPQAEYLKTNATNTGQGRLVCSQERSFLTLLHQMQTRELPWDSIPNRSGARKSNQLRTFSS